MSQIKLFIIVAALVVLAGCPTSSGQTYTVHGNVTVLSNAIAGNSVITVTQGSQSYTISVPILLDQTTWTFSVSGVPAGTYSVSISWEANSTAPGGSCLFNGGALPGGIVVGEIGSTVTMTVDSIPVTADVQLDASFDWL
jgi:hypothetical protein